MRHEHQNPDLTGALPYSVVGESTAMALEFGTAAMTRAEVHAGCTCQQAVTVEHFGNAYTVTGETILYMVDGRYYDHVGVPLCPVDSATVERHADALLGHRDDAGIYSRADHATTAPVRQWATGELYALATS